MSRPAGRLVSWVVLAPKAHPFEIPPEPASRGARERVLESRGQLQSALGCPSDAGDGSPWRKLSRILCLVSVPAEPFNVLFGQNRGG